MLCVATPNPDAPAETFVRQHIRLIAPGETVVLYFHGNGSSLGEVPSLRVRRPWDLPPVESFANRAYAALIHSYPGAVVGRSAVQVEKFFKLHGVDAVLAEFGTMGAAILPVCRKLNIPLAVNFHGLDGTVTSRKPTTRRAYRKLNQFASAIICGSEHFAGVLADLGFERGKISVVPCGIELDEFDRGSNPDPDLILAVGRFVEKKAPHLTIRAFERVLRQIPSVRLEMIGDGPLLEDCKNLVAGNGLAGKVIFHGARPHAFVKQKLAGAGLFVQHSVTASNGDTESQGISLLEAMASRVPVVSTRHNGFPEVVAEGETGYLVEERDVEKMAERMAMILRDRQLREKLGRGGRARVRENFEAHTMANRLNGLLYRHDSLARGS